jgi:hypothetical protein
VIEHVCAFDDCEETADYRLIARWPDGQVWAREVCLVRMARGIKSLQDFRGPASPKPTITQRALEE